VLTPCCHQGTLGVQIVFCSMKDPRSLLVGNHMFSNLGATSRSTHLFLDALQTKCKFGSVREGTLQFLLQFLLLQVPALKFDMAIC
jgi:hypothetical protein